MPLLDAELTSAPRSAISLPASGDVVLVGHEIPTAATIAALRTAHEAGATTILNPAPATGLSTGGPRLRRHRDRRTVASSSELTGGGSADDGAGGAAARTWPRAPARSSPPRPTIVARGRSS